MSHFIPAAPGTVAIVAYVRENGDVGFVDNAVFAFEVKDGPDRPWCLPISLAEIPLDEEDILGIQMADGTVAVPDRVHDSVDTFCRVCREVFADRLRLRAIRKADYDARVKEKADRKAIEDLL